MSLCTDPKVGRGVLSLNPIYNQQRSQAQSQAQLTPEPHPLGLQWSPAETVGLSTHQLPEPRFNYSTNAKGFERPRLGV